ncbi:MAG: hypothetical protein ABFE07_04075 [Armatimonadia bacterium]
MPDLRTVLTETLASEWVPSRVVYGTDQPDGFESHYDWAAHVADVLLGLPGVAVTQPAELADLEAEVDRLRAENATNRRLSGQANYLLARIVAAANLGAIEGADGFIEAYNLPVGPIHKAIPFLAEQGIAVTQDGQIKNGPAAALSVEGNTNA